MVTHVEDAVEKPELAVLSAMAHGSGPKCLDVALAAREAPAGLVGAPSAAGLQAVLAAASGPPPDLAWDEMAIDDPIALVPRRWAAA